ncbi:hypothetical protein Emag_006021 [Eimeria magna]
MEAAADAPREHGAHSPPAACKHSSGAVSPKASSEASSEAFVKKEPSESSYVPRSSQHDRQSASSLEASAESSSMDLQRRGPLRAPASSASAFIKGAPHSSQSSKAILRSYPANPSNAAAALDHNSSRAAAAAAATAAPEAGVTPIACSAGSPWRSAAAAARRRLNVGPPSTGPPPPSLFLDAVDAMQQRAEALLFGLQGGALCLLAKTKWAVLLGLGGCVLLGCLSSCLCAAAACSYYLLSTYSTPPPLHEFSVHFNFYPRVSQLLAAHEQDGGPLPASGKAPSSQPSEAPLHALEDRAPSPAGSPAAFDSSASSASPQVSAGGQFEGASVLDQDPSLASLPSQERGPPSNLETGAQGPPPSVNPLGHLGTWGPPPLPVLQAEQWGAPQGCGAPASVGRPGCAGEGGPFAFSLSSLEDPVAVAIVPFSNRSWELLPGDSDMFAAPPVSLSSHWMQQQQQQNQQQQQQHQQQDGEPKLPAFDVDIIMAVSVPPLSSSSSSSSSRFPPIMLSLLLYSGEGVLLARSSRVLPLPSSSESSLAFRLLSLLLPPKAAEISLPMLEMFPVGLLAQSRFARVYLYPPLPLRRAALLLQPKTHGLRRFLIGYPYLSFLLLTLLLIAAAAVAAACCCCCCCGYLVALAAAPEEEGPPPPLLASGPPQQLQSKPLNTGPSNERLRDVKGSSSCGVSTEQQHQEAGETVLRGPLMTGAPSLLLGAPSMRQRVVPTRHPATSRGL